MHGVSVISVHTCYKKKKKVSHSATAFSALNYLAVSWRRTISVCYYPVVTEGLTVMVDRIKMVCTDSPPLVGMPVQMVAMLKMDCYQIQTDKIVLCEQNQFLINLK